MSLMSFNNVSFLDQNKYILKDLSLGIEKGDYISILGPSGSGKSTFLKLCNNLITVSQGSLTYKDKNILEYDPLELRREICYCFQTPYLFGSTVMDNLFFPYNIRNQKADVNFILTIFKDFNIPEEFLNNPIKNLSGGEKQRIALIRSLLFKPEILLLDEVTSALDKENTLIVEAVIEKFYNEGVTILWVTHNEEQSRKYANKLLTIENGSLKALEVIKWATYLY